VRRVKERNSWNKEKEERLKGMKRVEGIWGRTRLVSACCDLLHPQQELIQ